MSRTRRDFALTVTAAAGAALLPAASGADAPKPAPAPSPTPAPDVPSPLAEALTAAAKIRFPGALSEAELREVANAVERGVKNGQRMRAVKITDADEPAFVFSARVTS